MSEMMERDLLYNNWIAQLKQKYQQQRMKAVVAVNSSLLQFYWTLGKDISEKGMDNRYGSQFYKQLSSDLNAQIPNVKGLSPTNLKYTKYFYELYSSQKGNRQQAVDDLELQRICAIPWGHHIQIIGRCHGDRAKALFFVNKTIEHNWSRNILPNFFIDLLFYNIRIHAYCVVELKASTFKPEHLGQLSFYVSAVNHNLKSEIDNPTIGILLCKDKDEVVAKYALDNTNSPIGISEYQLSELYPANFKGTLPSIEEMERELKDVTINKKGTEA